LDGSALVGLNLEVASTFIATKFGGICSCLPEIQTRCCRGGDREPRVRSLVEAALKRLEEGAVALLEDLPVPKSVLGLGLAIVALPFAFPSLRPLWGTAVKGGVKLYLEANAEAQDGLIDTLVEGAVDQLVDAIAKPVEERDEKIPEIVSNFKAKARRRSNRKGRAPKDRELLYDRHKSKLRCRLARLDNNPSTQPHMEEIMKSVR
jgi:hypothetical protein